MARYFASRADGGEGDRQRVATLFGLSLFLVLGRVDDALTIEKQVLRGVYLSRVQDANFQTSVCWTAPCGRGSCSQVVVAARWFARGRWTTARVAHRESKSRNPKVPALEFEPVCSSANRCCACGAPAGRAPCGRVCAPCDPGGEPDRSRRPGTWADANS